MLRDFRKDGDLSALSGMICIVGAGAAGITLARHLIAQGHAVLILESGGLDFELPIQELAGGISTGLDYYDLDQVNLRMVGGTTPIWGGRCAELDPIDFAVRPWVPLSGWPILPATMEPHYEAAARELGIARPADGLADLTHRLSAIASLHDTSLKVGCWSFDDKPNRFAAGNLQDLISHPRCWLVIHATVAGLHLAADGRRVDAITVKDIAGNATRISPRFVILAMGGIETPRLLLNSDDVVPGGLGNAGDMVGRCFMEHPHARGGHITGPASWQLLEGFGRSHRSGATRHAALLRLDEKVQQDSATLNSALTFGARQPAAARQALAMRTYSAMKHRLTPSKFNRGLWRNLKRASVWAHERVDPLRPWLLVQAGMREIAVIIRAEQAPNPESRVTLSHDKDAVGLRRVNLQWQLCDLDKHSVRTLVGALDGVLRARGFGAVEMESWLDEPETLWRTDPLVSAHPIGGYHHMGTTRMSLDERTGVVDRDCRMHGVENVFICGSSIFPTSGWANPTFTILALAIRLAGHLDGLMLSDKEWATSKLW
jgi:choline dehydrogenase-like flavoprotein